jgi:hypothetical protein
VTCFACSNGMKRLGIIISLPIGAALTDAHCQGSDLGCPVYYNVSTTWIMGHQGIREGWGSVRSTVDRWR